MRGNAVEALHVLVAEACIIFEYHVDSLVGNKPLTLIDKYLRSPSVLVFYRLPTEGYTRGGKF
jgi:hypothetical protein